MEDTLDPPVHLYIKTHLVTGLKYFGRTVKDPQKYRGSGLYWQRHLKMHGNKVETEVCGTYTSRSELIEAARAFSFANDIVLSQDWANLIEESGLAGIDGWSPDEEYRQRARERTKARWEDPTFREEMKVRQSQAWDEQRRAKHKQHLAEHWTDERKAIQSEHAKRNYEKIKEALIAGAKKPRSAETRKRISDAVKGRVRTQTHCDAIAAAARKRPPTKMPEGCEWLGPHSYESAGYTIIGLGRGPSKPWKIEGTNLRFATLHATVAYCLANPHSE